MSVSHQETLSCAIVFVTACLIISVTIFATACDRKCDRFCDHVCDYSIYSTSCASAFVTKFVTLFVPMFATVVEFCDNLRCDRSAGAFSSFFTHLRDFCDWEHLTFYNTKEGISGSHIFTDILGHNFSQTSWAWVSDARA